MRKEKDREERRTKWEQDREERMTEKKERLGE